MAVKGPTPEQLHKIVSNVTGPLPGLWIPASYRIIETKTGPRIIVVRTYAELTAGPRSGSDFWEDLVGTQLPPAVLALSSINILLERFTRRLDLHQALSEKFLEPNFRLSKPAPPETGRQASCSGHSVSG